MDKKPYLLDSSFLKELDALRLKEQYVKITVLNLKEKPIQDIQGRVTGGNFNLAGDSAMRRTANISLVADNKTNDLTDVNTLLSINKKIKVEIGIKNTTNKYLAEDIIWFPMGVYVIITPSISHNTQGCTISLQLKDKMCLLNGECGGTIPASTTLHEYEILNKDGKYMISRPTIYQIILELVNHFGGEQLGKILIKDLDTKVKTVVKWVGDKPLYYYRLKNNEGQMSTYLSLEQDARFENSNADIEKYVYGQDVGFIYSDFTFPGELIADAGSSVVTQLDKIRDALGNYEYFYDVDGNFVFQEKRNYLNTSYTSTVIRDYEQTGITIDTSSSPSVYTFDNSNLISSYTNSPQFNAIKNHFVIWGIRESAAGVKLPIRYELAIDSVPQLMDSYDVYYYVDEDTQTIKAGSLNYVYTENEFNKMKNDGIKENFEAGINYVVKYKHNIYKVFQREYDDKEKAYQLKEVTTKSDIKINLVPKDWREELYYQGVVAEPLAIDSNYYYTSLKNEFPKIYNLKEQEYIQQPTTDYDYYLDIIDSAEMVPISVDTIGRRTQIVNDNNINCIFEPEIPDIVLIESNTDTTENERELCENNNQPYLQVDSNIYSMFAIGGSFNSAYYKAQELLYQNTKYNNSISITSLPNYYLEPNQRITVKDSVSGIYGDYMISTISIPLGINGNMTLSCSKALEKL